MLLQNDATAGDTVTFKLVNGDEIIAEIVSTTPTGWQIRRPCVVVPSQQGIGLMQALFTGDIDRSIALNRDKVIFQTATIPEMASHYTRTTTGIEIPGKGVLR